MYPELSSHIQQSEDYQGYQQRLESDMPAIKQGDNYDTSKAKAISVAIGIAAPFTSGSVLHTNI